jgi:diguanylate cyclase (GGDEF)-like protein
MGGDEFVLIMPGLMRAEAEAVIAVFRRTVSGIARAAFGEEIFGVSVGLTQLGKSCTHAEELLAEADRDMYKGKRLSREASAA